MANINAIHSVCSSIIRLLHHAYEAFPLPGGAAETTLQDAYPCNFRVLASGELKAGSDFGTTLSLYLYRVTLNEHARSRPLPGGGQAPLSLDLHFLLTIWADSAAAEQTLCAWAMQQLHAHPVMDLSVLSREGGWRPDEMIQIVPAELSNDDMMRIWDTLAPDYRLSLAYIARVVRLDPPDEPEGLPVVATRYQYQEKSDDRD